MTYEEAKKQAEALKERFDAPYSASDKQLIEQLYFETTHKVFRPTSCQQCYHDAVIEIYCYIKNNKTMPKKCNYVMKAGFIISCPDFYNGKIFTNENLTDKVAKEYLDKYPKMEGYFQKIPDEELIENKQPATTAGGQPADKGDEKKATDPAGEDE